MIPAGILCPHPQQLERREENAVFSLDLLRGCVHRCQVVIAIFTLKLVVRLGIEGLAGDRATAHGTAEALRMIVAFLIDLHGIFGRESLSAGFTECFRQWTIGCWTTRHDRFLCLSAREKRMKCSRSSTVPFHTSLLSISVFFPSLSRRRRRRC